MNQNHSIVEFPYPKVEDIVSKSYMSDVHNCLRIKTCNSEIHFHLKYTAAIRVKTDKKQKRNNPENPIILWILVQTILCANLLEIYWISIVRQTTKLLITTQN